jgi:hypothetical protein
MLNFIIQLLIWSVVYSSPEVSPQEIRRIVQHESGGWLDARPGHRHWPHDARLFPKRTHYVCGLMQVSVPTAQDCVNMMSVAAGVKAGADAMRGWHRACRAWGAHGSVRYRCARAGYAHGTNAAKEVVIMSRQSYHNRILAALRDRDALELSRAEYVEVLENVAEHVDLMLSAAREEQQFEDAQTPIIEEEVVTAVESKRGRMG